MNTGLAEAPGVDNTAEVWVKATGGYAHCATWLDRCAWMAMQGLVTREDTFKAAGKTANNVAEILQQFAVTAYNIADVMLAEKRRREGGAA